MIVAYEALVGLKDDWDAIYQTDPEPRFFLSWIRISGCFRPLDVEWIVLGVKETAASAACIDFFPLRVRVEWGRTGALHNELRTGGG